MEESLIEKRFKEKIEKHNGLALKFISPGYAGMPDRMVLLPGGKIVFAELKAPGKKPRPLQVYRIKELKKLGFKVFVIDSIKGVEECVHEISTL